MRKIILAVAAAGVALTLSACGKKEEAASTEAASAADTAASAATEAASAADTAASAATEAATAAESAASEAASH